MSPLLRAAAFAALVLPIGAAVAQPASAPTAPATAASAATLPQTGERRVIEDDNVRIEETLVRGQAQSITVQHKQGGLRPYEIVVGRGGRDPSQDKGAAGQRVWSLFRF